MDLSSFFPIWNQLSAKQQETLRQSVTPRTVQKGTILHNGSMSCLGVVLVESGQLRAHILSDEGREITVYRLFEMDLCLFSASCMLRSIQFDLIISAEKDSEILIIPPEVFQSVMTESAPLANYMNEIMASRFSDVMWLLEQIMWRSFDKRLAAFLLEEATLDNTDSLKITHEIIANHLGTAREVVTRMLRYFQTEGMVKLTRGTIELIDKKVLRALQEA